MNISFNEAKMLLEMVWLGIKNGNNAEAEAFIPTPEQYGMLCDLVGRADAFVNRMIEDYGLE